VTNVWRCQREREDSDVPVRVLVLTYNRTLRGYVEELVEAMVDTTRFELTLDTFGRWALHEGRGGVPGDARRLTQQSAS
jgi:hypothetical protein